MNPDLKRLLEINNVVESEFEDELYNTLLISTFATLIKEIDSANKWEEVKDKYRGFRDHIHVTKLLLNEYIGASFGEVEYQRFYELLMAHMRKREQRKNHPASTSESLLKKQQGRCAICGCGIDLQSSELDHIVPWSLVGDELSCNLQMLCIRCNRRKSATTDYALLSTFLQK